MAHVSVIIPVRDRASLLNRAIASALTQDEPPDEVIVVDDASANPVERAPGWGATVVVVRFEHARGAAAARNAGMRVSRGEFIAFLDSDDVWLPSHLSEALRHLRRAPAGTTLVSSFEVIDRDGRHRVVRPQLLPGVEHATLLHLAHGSLTCSAIVVSRAAIRNGLEFDESLPALQDLDFLLQASIHAPVVVHPKATTLKENQPERLWTLERAQMSLEKLRLKWLGSSRSGHEYAFARAMWTMEGAYLRRLLIGSDGRRRDWLIASLLRAALYIYRVTIRGCLKVVSSYRRLPFGRSPDSIVRSVNNR